VISYNLNGANKSTKNNALLPGCRPGVLLVLSEKVFGLIRRACGPSGRPSDEPAVRNQGRYLFRGNVKSFVFSEIHLENNGFYAKKSNAFSRGVQIIFRVEEPWKKKSPFV